MRAPIGLGEQHRCGLDALARILHSGQAALEGAPARPGALRRGEAGMTAARGVGRIGGMRMGERLGGFLYGTLVALAVIVAGAKAYPHEPGHVAALVAIT